MPHELQLALKTYNTAFLPLVVAHVAITEGTYLLVHVQVTERGLSKRIYKNYQLLPHLPQLALKTYIIVCFTASFGTCGNN